MKPYKTEKGNIARNKRKYAKQMREYFFKKKRRRITLKYAQKLV